MSDAMATATEEFPVCGPRQPVMDALRTRQFRQSNFSDKWWKRLDGTEAHVYGAGSRLRLRRKDEQWLDGAMAEMLALIDQWDKEATNP